jgi:hypothetical protein
MSNFFATICAGASATTFCSGLEFLIAADIIDTLMKPDTRDIIVLGSIVAIRTVIGYSLQSELTASAQKVGPAASTATAAILNGPLSVHNTLDLTRDSRV